MTAPVAVAAPRPADLAEGAEVARQLCELETRGWTRLKGVYGAGLLEGVRAELEAVRPLYARIQGEAGVGEASRNALHHTLVTCRSMLRLLDPNPVDPLLTGYFGGKYILNTMGASFVEPDEPIYTQRIHRDVRTYTGATRLLVNTLIMLDDSTEVNGATWMASGSHRRDAAPSEEAFYATAERAVGRAGDVLVFDGNLWHCAGVNASAASRCIVTPLYSRPFMKQALDYPAALGPDFGEIASPQLRQVLGYNALTPKSLREFYQPPEKRFYQSDQG